MNSQLFLALTFVFDVFTNPSEAYGRVTNLKSESDTARSTRADDAYQGNLVEHFTALLLAVFFEAGLLKVNRYLRVFGCN
jgi:hypothetical protein